jgi:TPR repeat protein
MSGKSEEHGSGRSSGGFEALGGGLPRSRRMFVKSALLLPLGLQSVSAQTSENCCEGPLISFPPNDLFAVTSLAQDSEQARRGDIAATVRVGFRYYTGMAGRVDIGRARSYFMVVSRKSLAASAWLGYLEVATRKTPGLVARRSTTFQGLVSAAIAGDPVGQTLLGRVYERGLAGYRPRPKNAKVLYAAAAPNFALAKTYLGRLLVKDGAYQEAIALFEDAVAAGETTAMIALADLYSRRKRSPMKVAEVKRLLRMAGERRDRVALYLLGVQYQQGTRGFKADPQRALKLLHQSATKGYKPAQTALASAYANGAGGAAAAGLARFWARKASLPSLEKAWPPVHA